MHDSDVIVIVQEGKLPRCPYCRMFTHAVGKKHFTTKTCQTQAARVMERERVARQAMKANNIVFYVDNDSIETVSEYKYLGRILSAGDKDDAAIVALNKSMFYS
jgi:hypothetical protein